MLPKLTNKEIEVLRAIDRSEYGDEITDQIWTFSLQDNIDASIAARSIPGIVSSLVKKGYVTSIDAGDDSSIGMTEEGAWFYINTVGLGNHNKHFYIRSGNEWETLTEVN